MTRLPSTGSPDSQQRTRKHRWRRHLPPRSVCFTHQETSVFQGAPMVGGNHSLLFGNVDNDPNGTLDLAVGGVDGTLVVFKAAPGTHDSAPFFKATGLGTIMTLVLGPLLLHHPDAPHHQLVACSIEGMCHIFDLRWDGGSFSSTHEYTGRVRPTFSLSCPTNVTACIMADINEDGRQELVLGTSQGGVYVLSLDYNEEEDRGEVFSGSTVSDLIDVDETQAADDSEDQKRTGGGASEGAGHCKASLSSRSETEDECGSFNTVAMMKEWLHVSFSLFCS
ncbi:unnamed protein product [Choristocarpus tenellus]